MFFDFNSTFFDEILRPFAITTAIMQAVDLGAFDNAMALSEIIACGTTDVICPDEVCPM